MEEILHQLIGSLSHYLQGSNHPRWLAAFQPSTNWSISVAWLSHEAMESCSHYVLFFVALLVTWLTAWSWSIFREGEWLMHVAEIYQRTLRHNMSWDQLTLVFVYLYYPVAQGCWEAMIWFMDPTNDQQVRGARCISILKWPWGLKQENDPLNKITESGI